MSWLILLYFPTACFLAGSLGAWALRGRMDPAGRCLNLCRWALLLFPFILVAAILAKGTGPMCWISWAGPLGWRWVVLAALVGLIFVRWLGEMVARRAFLHLEQGPSMARNASLAFLEKLGFAELVQGLALPPWRVRRPPAVQYSKVAALAYLIGGPRPRICVEASLIPRPFRCRDLWWETVAPLADLALEPLRAMVAHELGHFKRRDHLRRQLLAITGCLLPWEWLYEDIQLRKFHFTNTLLFRRWSSLIAWIGAPFRQWILEDQKISEELADAEALHLVPSAADQLRMIRALYPPPKERGGRRTNANRLILPGFQQAMLLTAMAALLWFAPGRAAYAQAFGCGILAARFPHGWTVLKPAGANLASVFVPGQDGPGILFIRCQPFSRGQLPRLRCVGRIPARFLPGFCEIEMDWDVLYKGDGRLTGGEALLYLCQPALSTRPDPDPLTVYSRPRHPVPESLPRGWTRYTHQIKIKNNPDIAYMLIHFELRHPGNYAFKPPVLTVIHPDGTRQPMFLD
ncbi:MAG: hypothetical protein P4L36_20315 [Holophaga sp.]|nr:hypothetical protein [Holophaga sp.]